VDVIVTEGSVTSTITGQFTYNYDSTPIVTSISPNQLSVLGGDNITIIGTNLPVNSTNVQVGTKVVNIISSTSTTLVVQSPALATGLYSLSIPSSSLGNAL